jgi:hypothetical protein
MITKDMLKSIGIIKKQKLTMKNVPKANERLKVMFCALNGASQRRVYKRKECIYNNTSLGFYAARLVRVCSIALKVRSSACVSSRLLRCAPKRWAMAGANMDFVLDCILLSSSVDMLNRVLLRLKR